MCQYHLVKLKNAHRARATIKLLEKKTPQFIPP